MTASRRPESPVTRREVSAFRASVWRSHLFQGGALVVVFVLGVTLWGQRASLAGALRGENDLWGRTIFDPPMRVDQKALDLIDFERVHRLRLPHFFLAHARRGGHIGPHASDVLADAAYQMLRQELASDANLTSLVGELHELLGGHVSRDARRIDYLIWAYDDYLESRGIPYRIEGAFHRRRVSAILVTRSYRILADVAAEDEGRLLLLQRTDPTNVVEEFLGHAGGGEGRAVVVMDRVLRFAVQRVWPMLHPSLDGRHDTVGQAWAPAVRAELRAALRPEDFAILQETAVDQLALLEVRDAIHERHGCGSEFTVWGLPYNGLGMSDRLALQDAIARSVESPCPEVTLGEAARMIGASERLGATRGIEDAVESLAGHVAHAVVAHELDHLQESPAACVDCPPGWSGRQAGELAAYLAALEKPTLSQVAMYQLCRLPQRHPPGLHGRARELLVKRLLPLGCEGGPTSDLTARATRLSRRLFGETRLRALPKHLPRTVPLLPRRRNDQVADLHSESSGPGPVPRPPRASAP